MAGSGSYLHFFEKDLGDFELIILRREGRVDDEQIALSRICDGEAQVKGIQPNFFY